MKRPPAWLLRRRQRERRPQPVTMKVINSPVADEQFAAWMKKYIRRNGGNPGAFR